LERIEALEREGAAVPSLLAELRELVREAGEWAERERDSRAQAAVDALAAADAEIDSFALTRSSRSVSTVPRSMTAPIE
jgi:hypothetical protein